MTPLGFWVASMIGSLLWEIIRVTLLGYRFDFEHFIAAHTFVGISMIAVSYGWVVP